MLTRVSYGRKSLLGSISSTSLKPLRTLVKSHGSHKALSAYALGLPGYSCMIPRLQLFLGKNRLQFLPGTTYSLENLTVLSLRDNQLVGLLPSISRLTKLEELNLSVNSLRWLPWEVKKLAEKNLRQLQGSGNPWVEPNIEHYDEKPLDPDYFFEVPREDGQWFCFSSPVTLLDIDGSPRRGPVRVNPSMFQISGRSSTDNQEFPCHLDAWIPNAAPIPHVDQPSAVPSLMETVLRSCSRQSFLHTLVSNLPEDLPPSLSFLLRHALRVREAGGQECSVCGKQYIVPRTEWIEWWDLNPGEAITNDVIGYARMTAQYVINCAKNSTPLGPVLKSSWREELAFTPLLRFGCSWSCVVKHEAEWDG